MAPTVSSMGTVGIDAVLVVEVDVVDAEPRERRLAGLADVLGAAVDALPAAVVAAHVAELGRQHDLVASLGDGASDQQLVLERTVDVGRVEEEDAQVEGAVDGGDRLVVVGHAVELRHPHAAQPLGRHLEPLAAQLACLHRHLLVARVRRALAAGGDACFASAARTAVSSVWFPLASERRQTGRRRPR